MLPRKPTNAVAEWEPKMNWTVPTLVAEIRFAEWTQGGHLRAPVLLGLRLDRAPEDCIEEKPIKKTVTPVASQSKKSSKVTLTHQDKLYVPKERLTKGDLLTYYEQIAPVLLPHLKDTPSSLRRFSGGIQGKSFFQKNLPSTTPEWVPSFTL